MVIQSFNIIRCRIRFRLLVLSKLYFEIISTLKRKNNNSFETHDTSYQACLLLCCFLKIHLCVEANVERVFLRAQISAFIIFIYQTATERCTLSYLN